MGLMAEEVVWLGKVIGRDEAAMAFAVLIRGVFCTERDARGFAKVFGCDALVISEADQPVQLGEIVSVSASRMKTRESGCA
jgi:hypothetical protein